MKYIIGNRGCGATTHLIMESATFNIPILTNSSGLIYETKAHNMGIEIPKPITLRDLKDGKLRGRMFDKILVDNADIMLEQLLCEYGVNAKIITSTITLDETEL